MLRNNFSTGAMTAEQAVNYRSQITTLSSAFETLTSRATTALANASRKENPVKISGSLKDFCEALTGSVQTAFCQANGAAERGIGDCAIGNTEESIRKMQKIVKDYTGKLKNLPVQSLAILVLSGIGLAAAFNFNTEA